MIFVVVFIKFIDFSIGGNIADKRKGLMKISLFYPVNINLRKLNREMVIKINLIKVFSSTPTSTLSFSVSMLPFLLV